MSRELTVRGRSDGLTPSTCSLNPPLRELDAERLGDACSGESIHYRPLLIPDDRLVLSYPSGSLRCLSLPELELVWRFELPGPYSPVSFSEGAPLLVGERLVTRLKESWFILSPADGRSLRRLEGPPIGLARAVVADGLVTGTSFADGAMHLCQLALDTGEVRWSSPLPGPVTGQLTLCDTVVGLSLERSVFAAFDHSTGQPLWSLDVSEVGRSEADRGRSSPGRVAGPSLGVDSRFVVPVSACRVVGLDAGTGRMVWSTEVPSSHPHCGVHDGAESLYDIDGGQFVELSTRTGAIVRQRALDEPRLTGLPRLGALTDGHVWGGTLLDGRVFALERTSGRLAWISQRGSRIPADRGPVMAGRQLFVVDLYGNLRVFEADEPPDIGPEA